MTGDRGAITSARIDALRELDNQYGWVTALHAPAIRKLVADAGPLQLSLFDRQDLAQISSPGFPGERPAATEKLRPVRRYALGVDCEVSGAMGGPL